jgi:ATP-binding cassette subfamily B protein
MASGATLLRTKLRIGFAQLPYLGRALVLVWNAAQGWTAIWLVLLTIQAFLPIATVYLSRALVNRLVAFLQTDASWSTFRTILPLVITMAVVLLLEKVLGYGSGFVRSVQSELVSDHISELVHNKSVAVDLAFYDRPDYHDRLYRAQYHALDRPLALLENLGGLLQNGLTLVGMIAVLIPYSIWLPFVLLAASLPAIYIVLEHRLRLHEWRLKNTESERRTWYYSWLLTDRETAAELRIFELGTYFQSLYQSLRSRLRDERIQLAWKQGKAELVSAISAVLITGLTLAWMLWKTVQGVFTLGDLALFYQAFNQGQRVTGVLLGNLGEVYSNSIFLADLFEFLALDPQVTEPVQPLPIPANLGESICFEQVTFHYPGSQNIALCNFNLTIPAGSIVAIVGANGAGKSTLIKLLCRFYDPDGGRILMDGVDLRRLSLRELRRQITVLFQEPVHYQNTVLENIALGDLSVAINRQQVATVARAAGADEAIERLPQGFDSLLGKSFQGGNELSVGEWQRLALARAYWRKSPILVLDEPTSAMDPWAEHDWLQRFRQLAAGRTALIITHRFTTAMYADMIHVMANGHVVESGSHAELLVKDGSYARSWQDQMKAAGVEQNKASSAGIHDRAIGEF